MVDKLVEEMARDAKAALIGCRKCQGERTDWDELADAAAQACAAIAQKRVNELEAENAELRDKLRLKIVPADPVKFEDDAALPTMLKGNGDG